MDKTRNRRDWKIEGFPFVSTWEWVLLREDLGGAKEG